MSPAVATPPRSRSVGELSGRLLAGELVVVTGPSGSGRTHLLRAVEAALVERGETVVRLVGTSTGQTFDRATLAPVLDLIAPGRPRGDLAPVVLVDDVDRLDPGSVAAPVPGPVASGSW